MRVLVAEKGPGGRLRAPKVRFLESFSTTRARVDVETRNEIPDKINDSDSLNTRPGTDWAVSQGQRQRQEY